MASNDPASGTIIVKDITEATFIDIEKKLLERRLIKQVVV